jgi:hypothetical protein
MQLRLGWQCRGLFCHALLYAGERTWRLAFGKALLSCLEDAYMRAVRLL